AGRWTAPALAARAPAQGSVARRDGGGGGARSRGGRRDGQAVQRRQRRIRPGRRQTLVRQERTEGGAAMQHLVSGRSGRSRWWRPLVAAVVGMFVATACGGGASATQAHPASRPPLKIRGLPDHAPFPPADRAQEPVTPP